MNNTITLPEFAEQIAALTSIDRATAEKFVHAFFNHIENALAVSENVTVNGIGTFSRTSDHDNPVCFTPDSSLATAINQPFEIFEPVEISDGVDVTSIALPDHASMTNTLEITTAPSTDPIEDTAKIDVAETFVEDDTDAVPSDSPSESKLSEEADDSHQPADAEQIDISGEYVSFSENSHHRNIRPVWLFAALFVGLLAGYVIGYFCHDGIASIVAPPADAKSDNLTADVKPLQSANEQIVGNRLSNDSLVLDTAAETSIEQNDANKEPVYDTVTPERFLTTMARKYYGRMEYWAFIYEANADRLGNPNRIKPGTKVLIPDIDSITAGETPEQTLERAILMGNEIYNRFK